LAPGEVLCLLGPSGCGKTTLLRIAAGVERPTSGRVLLDGQEVAGPDRFVPPEKRGVGLMFQDFALFPHLSILENVTFGLKSLPREDARREAMAALVRVGLERDVGSTTSRKTGRLLERQRFRVLQSVVNIVTFADDNSLAVYDCTANQWTRAYPANSLCSQFQSTPHQTEIALTPLDVRRRLYSCCFLSHPNSPLT
jgi:ABC-type sugar transport system ATPase subunit